MNYPVVGVEHTKVMVGGCTSHTTKLTNNLTNFYELIDYFILTYKRINN